MKQAHPKSWFVSKVGQEIIRIHPKREGAITIEDELHADYLYNLQCEAGYRYAEK